MSNAAGKGAQIACRGISWAVPPYRCRQRDGVWWGMDIFGCRCCPRMIGCDEPRCDGSPNDVTSRSELLANCVCVSRERRAPAHSASERLHGAAAIVQVEDTLSADLTLQESLNNEEGAIPPIINERNCPRNPPVRCLDSQCRVSDDWKTEPLSTPRCSQLGGMLVIDGLDTVLYGCPCCPEFIYCSSADFN